MIERREADFALGVSEVEALAPGVHIAETTYGSLLEIDGRYDIIVCQTPVFPNRLPTKSVVVAQQYSLAKTAYQLGIWRSLCSLNLMYGPHSADRVGGFCAATAVGNPLFDGRSQLADADVDAPGLYLPTHGSLSPMSETLSRLAEIDAKFVVKLHHVTAAERPGPLPSNCVFASSARNPIDLIADSSFVISDSSGAAYDAFAARRPLILASKPDPNAEDFHRLGPDERTHSPLDGCAADWVPGRPLADALSEAIELATQPGAHEQFVDRYYSNFGHAGSSAAEAIVGAASSARSTSFSHSIVYEHVASSLIDFRALDANNQRLREANKKLRSRRQHSTHAVTNRLATRARVVLERTPRLQSSVAAVRRFIRSHRER